MTDGWLPIAPVSEDVVDQIMKLGCHPRLCNYPMCKNVFINEGSASCWGRISDRLRAALAAMLPAEPSEDALKFVAVEVRRNRFVRTRRRSFDERVEPTENELDDARASYSALRAHLGLE